MSVWRGEEEVLPLLLSPMFGYFTHHISPPVPATHPETPIFRELFLFSRVSVFFLACDGTLKKTVRGSFFFGVAAKCFFDVGKCRHTTEP